MNKKIFKRIYALKHKNISAYPLNCSIVCYVIKDLIGNLNALLFIIISKCAIYYTISLLLQYQITGIKVNKFPC